MTKSLFIPLATLLLVAAIVVASANVIYAGPSSQGTPDITLRIVDATDATSSHVVGDPGTQVIMAVIASPPTDATASPVNDMAGIQFRLEFDPAVLQVATDGVVMQALPGTMCPPIPNTENEFACGSAFNVDNEQGFVMIALAGAQAAGVNEMTIANITFDLSVLGGQNTPLTFPTDDGSDPVTDYLVAADDDVIPQGGIYEDGPFEIPVTVDDPPSKITITAPFARGDCDADGADVLEVDIEAVV